MLGWIKDLMHTPEAATASAGGVDEKTLAAAVLLVEAATSDGDFDQSERRAIEEIMVGRFALPKEKVPPLIEEVSRLQAESSGLFRFTNSLNKRFTEEERLGIVELLWEVVYADGVADHYETNLMRRIAGLLFLHDADVGAARIRVRERLGLH